MTAKPCVASGPPLPGGDCSAARCSSCRASGGDRPRATSSSAGVCSPATEAPWAAGSGCQSCAFSTAARPARRLRGSGSGGGGSSETSSDAALPPGWSRAAASCPLGLRAAGLEAPGRGASSSLVPAELPCLLRNLFAAPRRWRPRRFLPPLGFGEFSVCKTPGRTDCLGCRLGACGCPDGCCGPATCCAPCCCVCR